MNTRSHSKNGFPFEQSIFLREIIAEKQEILDHKWLESEKVGHDIGYDRAICSWVRYHRSKWLKQRRSKMIKGLSQFTA